MLFLFTALGAVLFMAGLATGVILSRLAIRDAATTATTPKPRTAKTRVQSPKASGVSEMPDGTLDSARQQYDFFRSHTPDIEADFSSTATTPRGTRAEDVSSFPVRSASGSQSLAVPT